MTLLGFNDIPTARTLGNFLCKVGDCDKSKAALDAVLNAIRDCHLRQTPQNPDFKSRAVKK